MEINHQAHIGSQIHSHPSMLSDEQEAERQQTTYPDSQIPSHCLLMEFLVWVQKIWWEMIFFCFWDASSSSRSNGQICISGSFSSTGVLVTGVAGVPEGPLQGRVPGLWPWPRQWWLQADQIVTITESKLALLAAWEANQSERRGGEARNTTVFGEPADQEEGRLTSQNNHLTGVWMPGSFIDQRWWGWGGGKETKYKGH